MKLYRAYALTVFAAGFAAFVTNAPSLAQQPIYPGEGVRVNGAEVLLHPGTNVVGVRDPLLQPGAPYPGTEQAAIKLIPPDQLKKRKATRIVTNPPAPTTQATVQSTDMQPVEIPARPAKKKPQPPAQQASVVPSEPMTETLAPHIAAALADTSAVEPKPASANRVPFSLTPNSPDIVIGPHGKPRDSRGFETAYAQPPPARKPAAAEAKRTATPPPIIAEPAVATTTPKQTQGIELETAAAMQPAIPASITPVALTPAPNKATQAHRGLSKRSEIIFAEGAVDPAPETVQDLRRLASDITGTLRGTGRVQLEAFGGPRGDKSSDARRLSLKRALAVRALLIESGVPAERIDVRALGGSTDTGQPDRVDVFVRSS